VEIPCNSLEIKEEKEKERRERKRSAFPSESRRRSPSFISINQTVDGSNEITKREAKIKGRKGIKTQLAMFFPSSFSFSSSISFSKISKLLYIWYHL